MKLTRIGAFVALAGVICLTPASSQQKPEGLAEMEKLQLLVGKWAYTETYEKWPAMPEGGTGTGTYEARQGPGGYSLLIDFSTHLAKFDEIGHGIITWDPRDKMYKQYIVGNSFPGCAIVTGRWEGNVLIFEGDFQAGETKFGLKSVYTEWTPRSITIQEYSRVGDAPFKLLQTTKATKP